MRLLEGLSLDSVHQLLAFVESSDSNIAEGIDELVKRERSSLVQKSGDHNLESGRLPNQDAEQGDLDPER